MIDHISSVTVSLDPDLADEEIEMILFTTDQVEGNVTGVGQVLNVRDLARERRCLAMVFSVDGDEVAADVVSGTWMH